MDQRILIWMPENSSNSNFRGELPMRSNVTSFVRRTFQLAASLALLGLFSVLSAWPQSVAAQSVGPSGCVANCGGGSSGGGSSRGGGNSSGGGYDPYAGAAAGALGAFMKGFMDQMQRQSSPGQQAYDLNELGIAADNRRDYAEAVE